MAIWKRVVPVYPDFFDPSLDFPTRRDAIIAKLHTSGWPGTNPAVADLVDKLADTRNETQFDTVWAAIYDQADQDRTWIDTRGTWGPIR